MNGLVEELRWRGLYYDATPALVERFSRGPIKGYVGFDPTAASLQIGNLVPVMLLAHLQRAGGTPIILVGGGTGLIGDPSGKKAERPLLAKEQVASNAEAQRKQLAMFLDFDCPDTGALMLDNAEWLTRLSLVDFLRDTGKHFTLSQMLQKESIKSRMEDGISFSEVAYMLLQAYDFYHLYTEHNCELQLGGSDQWGNITAGTELIRRAANGQAHGLCAPLLTTSTGAKFGKTEGGAVWLDPAMTSPYQFHQFWINVDDRDVENYLKVFTFRSQQDIADLLADHATNPGVRLAQHELASDLTARVHGVHVEQSVRQASRIIFQEISPAEAARETWTTLEAELPSWSTGIDSLPLSLVDVLAESGLTKSRGDSRRQLQQGGIYVNNERAAPDAMVTSDLLKHGYLWLRKGKKTNLIVHFQNA
jgi:tyrosyl-tRNA synthetase